MLIIYGGSDTLVILKSLSTLTSTEKYNAKVFLIVRKPVTSISGIANFPWLSPTQALLDWYKSNEKKEGSWDLYCKIFRKELLSTEKQVGLAMIENLSKGSKDVILLCYCKDKEHCHRSLIYEALVNRGVECICE